MRKLTVILSIIISLQIISIVSFAGTDSETIIGKVISVHDGDTIVVMDKQEHKHKIRLAEIDAPELKQEFGREARANLFDLVFEKNVRVEVINVDKYGREVGNIYLKWSKKWINKQMVKDGYAWQYKQYSTNESISAVEKYAKDHELGIWSSTNNMAPWLYRKTH